MRFYIGLLAFCALGLAAPLLIGASMALVCRLFLAGWKLVMP